MNTPKRPRRRTRIAQVRAAEMIAEPIADVHGRQLHEEVDRNLLDALDSGEATPLTLRDWQDIEREGLRRVRKKQNTRATR